ncbi:hypothetical protein ROA7450_00431 [Roseovarius albus]|uniref:Uncharacterized protein n=1 Tax=Roseovarius albus TaxID=1247867 RepID=A0A1X6YC72_9RHOB|nr:hypothetical protein ROA7450_00431 [Roseovarius albus]
MAAALIFISAQADVSFAGTPLNIKKEAGVAALACLRLVENHTTNPSELQKHGYEKRNKKYVKSELNFPLIKIKPEVKVEARTNRKFTSCSIRFSPLRRGQENGLYGSVKQVLEKHGYRQAVAKDRRGREKPVYVKGDIVLKTGGSLNTDYSTYSVHIYMERDK